MSASSCLSSLPSALGASVWRADELAGAAVGTVLAVFFVPTFYVIVRKFFPVSAIEQEHAAAHAKEVGITASPAGHEAL